MTNPRITKADLLAARISRHARETMARRNVTEADAAKVLLQGSAHSHKGLLRYVLGDLCVVWAPADKVVVTVLLFTEEVWDDLDARNRKR